MIDLLLKSISDMISQGVAALFHKDQPGQMDAAVYLGGNSGYTERARLTKVGQSASLEGCLYLDFGIEQNRAILNGVNINLKLFQASDEFRLMRVGTNNSYK